MPEDAEEVTYEQLMGMLFDEKGAADPAEVRASQREEWRSSRKLVNINALFSPR